MKHSQFNIKRFFDKAFKKFPQEVQLYSLNKHLDYKDKFSFDCYQLTLLSNAIIVVCHTGNFPTLSLKWLELLSFST